MERTDVRPRTIGQVIDAGLSLYIHNFRAATIAAGLITLPVALFQIWNARDVPAVGLWDGMFGILDPETFDQLTTVGIVNLLIDTGALFIGLSLTTAIFVPVYHGQTVRWNEAYRTVARSLFSLLLMGLTFFVCGALGLILLVVPGVWLMTMWSNSIPAMFDRSLGASAALRRSFELVRGRFFPMFGILTLTFLMQATPQYVGYLVAAAANWMSGAGGNFVVTQVLTAAIANLFSIPLLGGVLTAAYFDHRTRREGLDVELALAALPAGTHPPSPNIAPDDDVFGLRRPS